jgi:glutaredoxin
MKRLSAPLLCALAVSAATPLHAESTVYRWVDKDGKVQFGDQPPSDAKNVTERRFAGAGSADDAQLPYATQVAAKRHPVTLYVSNDCDLCKQGRALLGRRGVPFSEKNAQTSPADREALMKLAGALKVPFLLVGETKVTGFDEDTWTKALDAAGYASARLPGGQATSRTDTATK